STQRSTSMDDSIFDQSADEDDQDTHSKKGSASSRSNGPAYNSSGNSSIVFGGSDRSDTNSSKSRVGPLERDRQARNTSGGNSGRGVRINPANAPPGPPRESNSVFDQREESTQNSDEPPPFDRGSSTNRQSTRSDQPSRQAAIGRRPETAARIDEEIPSSNPRESGPPVLNRSRGEEPSAADNGPATETKANSTDEEAIVLKAALVSMNVSVTNRAGVALANLKKQDFSIAENGESQKIEFFQPTTAPFNLVLALDLSGSIKDKLDVVNSAALPFLGVLI